MYNLSKILSFIIFRNGTLTIAQNTMHLKNVTSSLSTVFGTIAGTVKDISQTIGSLTDGVQRALTVLLRTTIQLVQAIFYAISTVNPNVYEQVTKDVGSVTISGQQLMKVISEVAARVVTTGAIETKTSIDAVSALCMVLYTA